MTATDTTRWRALLLDALDDEARDAVEARMFLEPGVDDAIAVAEDALIADYLDGRLPAAERVRFERVYLAPPRHRARVEAVRLLRGHTRVRRARPRAWWLAAAAAVILIASATLLRRPAQGPVTPDTAAPAPRPTPAPASPIVATLVLTPPVTRGSGVVPTLTRPAPADVVRLEAPFVEGAVAATIESPDTATPAVRVETRPRATGGATVDIAASRLPVGDYTITFSDAGGRTVARTAFRVE